MESKPAGAGVFFQTWNHNSQCCIHLRFSSRLFNSSNAQTLQIKFICLVQTSKSLYIVEMSYSSRVLNDVNDPHWISLRSRATEKKLESDQKMMNENGKRAVLHTNLINTWVVVGWLAHWSFTCLLVLTWASATVKWTENQHQRGWKRHNWSDLHGTQRWYKRRFWRVSRNGWHLVFSGGIPSTYGQA